MTTPFSLRKIHHMHTTPALLTSLSIPLPFTELDHHTTPHPQACIPGPPRAFQARENKPRCLLGINSAGATHVSPLSRPEMQDAQTHPAHSPYHHTTGTSEEALEWA